MPGAQGRDQRPDLLGRDHLVEAGFFDVENLALQRQDRLVFPVPSLLGRTPGGVTFDQEQFAQRRILFLAVGQFSRESVPFPGPLSPGQIRAFRAASRARAASMDFSRIRLAIWGFSSRKVASFSFIRVSTYPFTSELPSFVLVCPRTAAGESLPRSPRSALPAGLRRKWPSYVFQQVVGVGIGVHGPGEGSLETDQVGPSFMGVDVIGKGKDLFVVAVVVLHGDFYLHSALLAFNINRLGVDGSCSCSDIRQKTHIPPS